MRDMSLNLPLIAVAVLAAAGHASADILFVDDDAPPGGDGAGWSTAMRYLQEALTAAGEPGSGISEIRVAQGAYRPNEVTPTELSDCCDVHAAPGCDSPGCETLVCTLLPSCCDTTWSDVCVAAVQLFCGDLCVSTPLPTTFQLVDGMALRGGYAGLGAIDPDARDPVAFPTVLDGDLDGDDDDYPESCCSPHATAGCSASACEAQVCAELPYCCEDSWDLLCAAVALSYITPDCVLATDCPEIDGNADVITGTGTGPTTILDGLTVTRSRVGVHLIQGGAAVEQCTFVGNRVGLRTFLGDVTINGCVFAENVGPGLLVSATATATVTGCVFTDNAAYSGAGINGDGGTVNVTACTLSGNRALIGGGMYLGRGAVINCTFTGNHSWGSGGGVTITQGISRIIGCVFEGNSATDLGGGAFFAVDDIRGRAMIVSSLFVGNTAASGAGVYAQWDVPLLSNCTLTGNVAGIGGGAVSSEWLNLVNCVLWNNAPDEIDNGGSPMVQVVYSDVQGGFPGPGNIDADPLFVNPTVGDYHLAPGSPCIDAGRSRSHLSTPGITDLLCDSLDLDEDGDTVELIPVDLDGRLRFFDDPLAPDTGCAAGPVVDLGAYESAAPPSGPRVVYCDMDGDGEVGINDLLLVLAAWGPCDDPCCLGDLGAVFGICRILQAFDGNVSIVDLLCILSTWGQ